MRRMSSGREWPPSVLVCGGQHIAAQVKEELLRVLEGAGFRVAADRDEEHDEGRTRLRAYANAVDAAVCCIPRNTEGREAAMLTVGCLVGALTSRRVVIVAEGSIPSGCNGVAAFVTSVERAAVRAVAPALLATLSRACSTRRRATVPLWHASRGRRSRGLMVVSGHRGTARGTSARYEGEHGATAWYRLAIDPDRERPLLSMQRRLANLEPYRLVGGVLARAESTGKPTIVASLGCGDGLAECALLDVLHDAGMAPEWLPIDINVALLNAAIERAKAMHCVRGGIVADFEGDLCRVLQDVRAVSGDARVCVTAFGYTIANLDVTEGQFLRRIRASLRPGDSLAWDLPLKGRRWSAQRDPHNAPSRYPLALNAFLCSDRLHGSLGRAEREDVAARRPTKRRVVSPTSDVPGTSVWQFREPAGSEVRALFRRYDWPGFLNWLRKSAGSGLSVTCARMSSDDPAEVLASGMVVLTRNRD